MGKRHGPYIDNYYVLQDKISTSIFNYQNLNHKVDSLYVRNVHCYIGIRNHSKYCAVLDLVLFYLKLSILHCKVRFL